MIPASLPARRPRQRTQDQKASGSRGAADALGSFHPLDAPSLVASCPPVTVRHAPDVPLRARASPAQPPLGEESEGRPGPSGSIEPAGDLVARFELLEHGILLCADGLHEGAARGEAAAWRDVAPERGTGARDRLEPPSL